MLVNTFAAIFVKDALSNSKPKHCRHSLTIGYR